MNTPALLVLFAALTLSGLVLVGRTTEELGFDYRQSRATPPPPRPVVPEQVGARIFRATLRGNSPDLLPDGIVPFHLGMAEKGSPTVRSYSGALRPE